jgi:hypothetical protein
MTARAALTVAAVIGAVIAVYLAVSAIIGLLIWIAIFAVLALAVVAAVTIARRPATAFRKEKRVRTKRVSTKSARDIVDCAGESLRIGDTVRAGADFDGPMELAFSRGVIVKIGRGKAHVRFEDIPQQVHPVTAATLRRLA